MWKAQPVAAMAHNRFVCLYKREGGQIYKRGGKGNTIEDKGKSNRLLRVESAVSGAAEPLCLIVQIDAARSLVCIVPPNLLYGVLVHSQSIATKFASFAALTFAHLIFLYIFPSLQVLP